jgi:hypothetical protein
MFQAMGTHGPVLSPQAGLILDILLVVSAFILLARPVKRPFQEVLFMATLVISVSLLRVVMQPLPNVQPVTVAALLVGSQLGARRGAAFAVLVAMLSNFFMGDGWWTIFQATAWASVAVIGSQLNLVVDSKIRMGRAVAASLFTAVWFDVIVSFSILNGSIGVREFMTYLVNGIPFDLLHMLGNLTFMVWAGAWFARILEQESDIEDIEFMVVNTHAIDG